MEPQKAPMCNSDPEKERNWRNHIILYQTILQGHGNQNSMVLTYKQAYGTMEQNRESRNKPTPLESINISQRKQAHTMC